MENNADTIHKLIAALRTLEWAGYAIGQGSYMGSNDGRMFSACAICGGIQPGQDAERDFQESAIGHTARCHLHEILKGAA